MKTNREKYEHYRQIIEAKDAEAIAVLLPKGVPPQFFRIEAYEASPVAVTDVHIWRRGIYKPGPDERMTKVDVELAKQCANGWQMPTISDVRVGYQYKAKFGTIRGADPYQKIDADPMMAWTAEELQPEIERRRALYAPREGCKPCGYCQKQTLEAELVSREIFYRDQGGAARKTKQYCSAQCGFNDQCGHEG